MQEEMIKLFVKDTNHETISKLPGISSAVARVKSGVDWKVAFVLKTRHNIDKEEISFPKLVIMKSPGKNEQIFAIQNTTGELIWVYPEYVCVGTQEIYNKDMFIDPSSPTQGEVQMLRMAKGCDLGAIMKGLGRVPGRIIERVISGMFIEEYVTPNHERVIVLIA